MREFWYKTTPLTTSGATEASWRHQDGWHRIPVGCSAAPTNGPREYGVRAFLRKMMPNQSVPQIRMTCRTAAATILAAVISAGILLTAGLRRLANDWGPQTGDIISFPATKVPSISTASIKVNPAGASVSRQCVLDVHVVQKSGGSLVVEATGSNPTAAFRFTGPACGLAMAGKTAEVQLICC